MSLFAKCKPTVYVLPHLSYYMLLTLPCTPVSRQRYQDQTDVHMSCQNGHLSMSTPLFISKRITIQTPYFFSFMGGVLSTPSRALLRSLVTWTVCVKHSIAVWPNTSPCIEVSCLHRCLDPLSIPFWISVGCAHLNKEGCNEDRPSVRTDE